MVDPAPRTEAPGRHLPAALPPGTRLLEFEVRQVLGIGGFGIVYLAFDHALEREVAVKEYMPASLADRTETLHVSLRSHSDAETFALGLRSFVNEAKLLAQFDDPALVKVYRFWEANGTAYMAMPVYRGKTLKQVRESMGRAPDEAWLRAMLIPLLGALAKLHDVGVFHRDISPDNILMEADGRPVLLDFGAARRVIADRSQNLTAILKPSYAPIEQYAEVSAVRQGPWTDFYALGATLHYMLKGRPPSPATARAVHDDLVPLSSQPVAGHTPAFLNVIDWMLGTRPADRPQSVAALVDVLSGRSAGPRPIEAPTPAADPWQPTLKVEPPAPVDGARQRPMAEPGPRAPAAASARGGAGWRIGLGGAVVVLGAAAWWFVARPAPGAAPAATAVPLAVSPTSPTAAAAPAPAIAPAEPAAVPASAPVSLPAAAPAARPAAPADANAGAAPPPPRAGAPRTVAPTNAAATNAAATNAGATVDAQRTTEAPPRPPVRRAPAAERSEPVERSALPAQGGSSTGTMPAGALPRGVPDPRADPSALVPRGSVPAAPSYQGQVPLAASPSERCGSRRLVAMWNCMARECRRPDLFAHAECVQWRAYRDSRTGGVPESQ